MIHDLQRICAGGTLTMQEAGGMKDAIPLATAIVGMGVAMWVLHRVVELWW